MELNMPSKPTKKAKRVVVDYEKTTTVEYISQYTCPCCKVNYRGYGPNKNVTRFLCKCGQELIVQQVKE